MPATPGLLPLLDAALRTDVRAVVGHRMAQLPSALAAATAQVLQADGASLSLVSLDLRVPLGASSAEADAAERLQSTLGDGPCLQVLHERRSIVCDLSRMQSDWPLFAQDLAASTSYRSVASVPLPFSADGGGGALDLYHRAPAGATGVDLADAALAADWIVGQLVEDRPPLGLTESGDASRVPWLGSAGSRRRMEVWVAIGLLSSSLSLDSTSSLAVLRGWAYSHGTDLDSVAADVAAGRLDPERLRP